MNDLNADAMDLLRRARGRALAIRPYWARILYSMPLHIDDRVPSLAVDKHARLYANPHWLLQYGRDIAATGVVHEAGHLLLRHYDRAEAFGVTAETADHCNTCQDCFPAGTMLADGLPIEAPRTQTLSGNGEQTACVNLRREWDGEMVTLRGHGVEITSTPEHPIWIYRRRHKKGLTPVRLHEPAWTEAGLVRPGDFMLVPAIPGEVSAITIDVSEFGGNENRTPLKTGFPLNEQTAWLLGLYAAEGSGTDSAQLSLGHSDEERALADRAITIARSLGYDGRATNVFTDEAVPSRVTGTRVTLGGPVLARAMKAWCGDGSHGKRVPNFILQHTDTALCHAFLEGLVAGDGYERSDRRATCVSVHTTSRALLVQVRLLLARLGLGFWGRTITQRDRYIGRRLITGGQPIHQIGWTWNPQTSTRVLNGKTVTSWSRSWRHCDEGILIPVKEVARSRFVGSIYNLSCDRDHTFIAEGVKVHNCELNDDIRDAAIAGQLSMLPDEWCVLPWKLEQPDYETWEFYFRNTVAKIDSGAGGSEPKPCCGSGATGIAAEWELGSPTDESPGLDDAGIRDVRRRVAEDTIEYARRGRGSVPGQWIAWAVQLVQPKPVPWEQLFEDALTRTVALARGFMFPTYSRLSRRQDACPDMILPAYVSPRPDVAFIGDTSASMSEEQLGLVRGLVRDVCDAHEAQLTFLAVDAAVHSVRAISSDEEAEFVGRGGTNMCVGIEAAVQLTPPPDAIVVATDCDTEWPASPPPVPVIVAAVGAQPQHLAKVPSWAITIVAEIA